MKKLKVLAAALLASVLPLSGCSVLGVEIPGSQAIMDLLNKVDIFDIIPDNKPDDPDKPDDDDPDHPDDDEKKVNNVRVEGTNKVKVGATVKLTALVSADEGVATTVTWKSETPAVATVAADGTVTGVSAGTAKIVATSTVDPTKSGYLEVTVEAAEWSAADKAMFDTYLGEDVPYFIVPQGFAWTDEYVEDYGFLSLEGSGDHVAEIVAAMQAAGLKYNGSETDEHGDVTHSFETATKNPENADYYIDFEVYVYSLETGGTVTSVDVGLAPITYAAWPTSLIASKLAELPFGASVQLPAFTTTEDFKYTAMLSQLESGEDVLYLTAIGDFESEVGAADYVALFSEQKYDIIDYSDGSYMLQAKDKSHSIIVYDQEEVYDIDWEAFEIVYAGGFEVIVAPYQADLTVEINEAYEMVQVGAELQLTLTKGGDVDPSTAVTWASSNNSIATVADGKVTGVSEGEVTITATIGDSVSEAVVYVVNEIPTAFTQAQIAELNKVGEGVTVPFNKYMETVEYDEEYECTDIFGKYITHEMLLDYYNTMIADGWEYLYADYLAMAEENDMTESEMLEYLFSEIGYFEFEKVFEIGGVNHAISALIATVVTEDGQLYLDYDGELFVELGDYYIYDAAEAAAAVKECATEDLGLEEEPAFPANIGAGRFNVMYEEADETYPADVALYAYDVTDSLEQVAAKFEALGYTVLDLTEDNIDVLSEDETVEVYGGIMTDGSLVLWLLEAEGGGTGGGGEAFECEETITFSEQGFTNQEDIEEFEFVNGAVATFSKGTNNSNGPKYYDNGTAIRCYGGNTITFTAPEGGVITEIEFTFSSGEGSNEITANVGSYADGVWTGEASEVIFTIGGTSGHRRIAAVHIEYSGVEGGGGGGGGGGTTEDAQEQLIQELICLIFDQESAEVDVDYWYEDGYYTVFQAESLTESIDQLYAIVSQVYNCEQYDEDGYYGFYVDSNDGSCYADVYSIDDETYGILIEIDIWEYDE